MKKLQTKTFEIELLKKDLEKMELQMENLKKQHELQMENLKKTTWFANWGDSARKEITSIWKGINTKRNSLYEIDFVAISFFFVIWVVNFFYFDI